MMGKKATVRNSSEIENSQNVGEKRAFSDVIKYIHTTTDMYISILKTPQPVFIF